MHGKYANKGLPFVNNSVKLFTPVYPLYCYDHSHLDPPCLRFPAAAHAVTRCLQRKTQYDEIISHVLFGFVNYNRF